LEDCLPIDLLPPMRLASASGVAKAKRLITVIKVIKNLLI
jgi:hypothetical protein